MSFEGKCCVSNDIGIYFWVCFGVRIIILLYFLIAELTSTGGWYMFIMISLLFFEIEFFYLVL